MDKWSLIHGYRRLVRLELAEDIRCPEDNSIYAVKIDSNDAPVLHCYTCVSTVTPGLSLWKALEASVANHPVEAQGVLL